MLSILIIVALLQPSVLLANIYESIFRCCFATVVYEHICKNNQYIVSVSPRKDQNSSFTIGILFRINTVPKDRTHTIQKKTIIFNHANAPTKLILKPLTAKLINSG